MVITIVQTEFNIEEQYHQSSLRKIRQGMDLFTDEREIPIEINDDWMDLKVIARNSLNREIAFLVRNEGKKSLLILNLDPLISFPLVPPSFFKKFNWNNVPGNDTYVFQANVCKSDEGRKINISNGKKLVEIILDENNNKAILSINDARIYELKAKQKNNNSFIYLISENIRHVKLEIEYILTNPKIERFKGEQLKDKIIKYILIKKYSTYQISGLIQPDIGVTLPPGWRISKQGHSVGMIYIIKKIIDGENVIYQETKDIKFEKPLISIDNDEKRTYHYLITENSYKRMIEDFKNNGSSINFEFIFISQTSLYITVVSLVPFIIFLPIASIILYSLVVSIYFNLPLLFDINFATIYLLVIMYYFNFNNKLEEKYDIPYSKFGFYIIIFSIVMFCIIFIKNSSPQNITELLLKIV